MPPLQALAESTGRKEAVIKKEYEAKGDLGVVAVSARTSQRTMFPTKPLTIRGVFQVGATGGVLFARRGAVKPLVVWVWCWDVSW